MPTSWKSMSVANLRDIARSYKNLHSLGNISKQPKAILTETLSKVMEWKKEKLYTKKEHGGTKVATYAKYEGDIVNTHDKAVAPAPKKAVAPAPPATAPKKAEDKSYKKSVVAKKVIQARGANADAKAIAPPTTKNVKNRELEAQVRKRNIQARGAVADAKAIVPPKADAVMEEVLPKDFPTKEITQQGTKYLIAMKSEGNIKKYEAFDKKTRQFKYIFTLDDGKKEVSGKNGTMRSRGEIELMNRKETDAEKFITKLQLEMLDASSFLRKQSVSSPSALTAVYYVQDPPLTYNELVDKKADLVKKEEAKVFNKYDKSKIQKGIQDIMNDPSVPSTIKNNRESWWKQWKG